MRNFDFHVFSSSKGGSFVRPKKVSGGMSCFLAVNDRYGQTSEHDTTLCDKVCQ
jgi:hypothetical protein